MKSIKDLTNWKLISVILLSIFTLTMCVKDDDSANGNGGGTPGGNNDTYDWKIIISQSGNYSEFTKAISVDGSDDFDWLYNQDIMDQVQFGNNHNTIEIENNNLKYKEMELAFTYYTNTGTDTMELHFKVFKDTELIHQQTFDIFEDFDKKFKY
ncbi:MAG: beta-barrel fold lipoprotein [Flavobacteriales bacterium]|jgi:hypothetical protein